MLEVALLLWSPTGYYRVYVDNLFTFLDLLDHMGDKGYGVTYVLRAEQWPNVVMEVALLLWSPTGY